MLEFIFESNLYYVMGFENDQFLHIVPQKFLVKLEPHS